MGHEASVRRVRCGCVALALAAVAGSARAEEEYKLLYDLRTDKGTKEAEVKAVGDVVTMELFAFLGGSNASPDDDMLQSGAGTFSSSNGGLQGDLRSLAIPSPFNALGSATGLPQDMDGDGDRDVGPAGLNPWAFRAGSMISPMPAGGFRVGKIKFTVTSLVGSATNINFSMVSQRLYGALFTIDGQTYNGEDPGVLIGDPITIWYDGTIIPPSEIQYLAGTVTEHVTVRGTVRPQPETGTLVLAGGLDVTSEGDFAAPGPHEVRVEDDRSGNAGGTLLAGHLFIGQAGTGVFTQSGGLTQVSHDIVLGRDRGSSGTLRATGGSMSANQLTVGEYGSGTFIQSGGQSTLGSLDVGIYETATAVLEVDGNGELAVSGMTRIGAFGPGLFRQKGGSSVFGEVFLGYQAGADSVGTMEITGGSLSASWLNVGREGTGIVTQTGGTVAAPVLNVGYYYNSESPEAVNRYTLQGGKLTTGGVVVGGDGNGMFVQSGGNYINLGTAAIRTFGSGARFELRGGEYSTPRQLLAWDGDPEARRRYRGEFIQSGGNHNVDFFRIGPNGKLEYSGGTLRVNEYLENLGEIDFANSDVTLTIGEESFIDFSKGTLSNSSRASIVAGENSLMSFPAGYDPFASFASIQTQGLIHVDGQPLAIPMEKAVHGSGRIGGNVTNEGLLSPGHSPGKLVIEGDYVQEGTGTLMIEIGGTGADEFDVLEVTGEAKLDGMLNVTLLGGFVPSATDEFVILTADSVEGWFRNAGGWVVLDGGIFFNVVYGAESVTLTGFDRFVPEPGCLGIVALAGMMLGRRRRR